MGSASAQQYPVQGTFAINSPYPAYISDYANSNIEKLALNLTLTDINLSNKRIKLKLFIQKQNSLIAQSTDNIIGEPTIILDGGVPQRFTSLELANYFRLENLQGINGDAYGQPLPEGVYTIGFEVYDYFTGNKLSSRISQMFWLMLSDPPLLNMPMNRENVAEFLSPGVGAGGLIFQWTPRTTQVSNTEYEFTLSELWDEAGDPYQQFLAAIPKYQTTTNNTTLLYGISEPPLLAGRTYAWQVRAKAKAGFEDIGLYRQNGYSEIFVFKYGGQCALMQNVNIEVKGYDRLYITWELPIGALPTTPLYKVAYRKYTPANNWEWHEVETFNPFLNLFDLEANTEYEIKVGGVCEGGLISYSPTQRKRTLQNGQLSNINCGQAPVIDLNNQILIERLVANDVVMANDFPMTLTRVEGSKNGWSGEGWVKIPWLADTKIRVKYTGIKVNTDKKLIDGYFETTYEPTGKNIGDADEFIQDVKGLVNDVAELVKMSIDKDYKEFKELKDVIMKVAEEELPESLKQDIATALGAMDAAKQAYDAAKKEYDEAKTPEEKEAAKEKIEKAKTDYDAAQEKVKAVQKEQDRLVKEVADIVVKAIKALKKDYDNKADIISKAYKEKQKQWDEYEREALKKLTGSSTPSPSNSNGKGIIISIEDDSDSTFESEFNKIGRAYKEAELENNKVVTIAIFDRDISNKEFYALLQQVFKINGKYLLTYLNERNAAGDTEEQLINNIRQELDKFIAQILLK